MASGAVIITSLAGVKALAGELDLRGTFPVMNLPQGRPDGRGFAIPHPATIGIGKGLDYRMWEGRSALSRLVGKDTVRSNSVGRNQRWAYSCIVNTTP